MAANNPLPSKVRRHLTNTAPLLAAGLLYTALTLLFFHPDPLLFDSTIGPDPGDPIFNLSLLKWGAAQWRLGLPDYWNAPFFFPTPGTVTLSDHLLGPSALVALAGVFGVDAVSAYNLMFLGSFVLCGLATFWVLRRTGLSWCAAFVGGLIFTFSPYRLEQRPHLQVLLAFFVPLVLYAWDRLLAGRSLRAALAFVVLYGLHLSGGNYLAYMIHLPLAAILLVRCREHGRSLLERRSLVTLGAVGVACALLLVAIFLPYHTASPGFEVGRSDGDWRAFGATLMSLATPSPQNFTFPPQAWSWLRPENTLAAGILPTLLALAGLFWLRPSGGEPLRRPLSPVQRWGLAGLLAVAVALFALAELRTWGYGGRWPELAPFLESLRYHRLFRWLALALILAGWLWRRWGGRWPTLPGRTPWERGLLAAGGLSLLLCWPIFFVPLSRVLPGLDRMRVPTRFYTFASLALAFLVALALDHLRARLGGRRGFAVVAVLTGLLVLELTPRPMTWWRVQTEATLNPVYRWLREADEVTAVAEIPAGDIMSDIAALYAQSFHGKPLFNGFSGHLTPDYLEFVACCGKGVPSDETLARLRAKGVSHLVIWPPRRWKEDKRRQLAELETKPGVKRVYRSPRGPWDVRILSLTEPSAPP